MLVYRDVLSLGEELSSVSLGLSSNFSIVGDVHGGVVCSDVDDETDVKLQLLIDNADDSSRREIESRTSAKKGKKKCC